MKIREVIEKVIAFHPPIDEEHTCDVVKFGDVNQECTGVAVCLYVSPELIKEAAKQKINLLICHEPLFYSHEDDTEWLESNSVFEEKRRLLEEYNMVVWRDHDHIHGGSPARIRDYDDLIFTGIMKELDWEKYCIGFPKKPLLYEIPETTVEQLTQELLEKLNLTGARIVGDKQAKIRKVFFCEHVNEARFGDFCPDKEAIKEIEAGGYDVLIPFEIIDWTISEYVRDSVQTGRARAIIEMGHFNVEELGMRYMAKWLPEVLEQQVPVVYIQSGDTFDYILRK